MTLEKLAQFDALMGDFSELEEKILKYLKNDVPGKDDFEPSLSSTIEYFNNLLQADLREFTTADFYMVTYKFKEAIDDLYRLMFLKGEFKEFEKYKDDKRSFLYYFFVKIATDYIKENVIIQIGEAFNRFIKEHRDKINGISSGGKFSNFLNDDKNVKFRVGEEVFWSLYDGEKFRILGSAYVKIDVVNYMNLYFIEDLMSNRFFATFEGFLSKEEFKKE